MPEVLVENAWGVVDGLDYERSRDIAERLNTEVEFQGTRVRFKPTRYALDLLVKEFGAASFHSGCRFAWGHFYKDTPTQEVEFNFVTQPYPHQREWFSNIKDLPFFALEWEMGLGKTKTILDVCHWAYSKGDIDAILVVTLKGVHRKWVEKEAPAHLPRGMWDGAFWKRAIVDNGMWTGENARKRTPIIESKKLAIATINFESCHRAKGLKFCERFMRQRKVALVVDESHHIKTPSAATTKALLKLGKMAKRRYITTGTVSTGSPLDTWSQYSFLDPRIVNNWKYWAFKAEFAVQEQVGDKTFETWEKNPVTGRSQKVEKPVMAVVGYKNEDKLRAMLDPYRSRLLKEDCLDLPPKLYRMRSFEMTDAMRKAYIDMSTEFLTEFNGSTMTASMAMVKLLRLQQITCGYIVPDDVDPTAEDIPGIPIEENNPRIEALMEEIEKIRGMGVIWSYKRYCLREIAQALRSAYGDASVVEYHGGIDEETKAANLRAFHEERCRWFVGNPQSGGTGIDLVQAQDMIYHDNSFNLGLRLQSEDRIHRIGQEGTACTITDLECLGTIDRLQLRSLKDKRDIAASVSGDLLKQWLTESV
ncbi:superfamily II DNA/RNA helicase [Dinoroseobacter phage vB_DshS-R5C]|uniref:Superfamily II DNA/RNA helicase n=1 Tax=Dinoroseobacter phage vB_DshS-R5C TaxID=1965368 RepID=A0A1V0DY85_9CAUD|nr:superfamily II DNA/RNA helicase [Dinoroseobacter phage vB_DshS-R5C]ARB06126.1 superfamily II DNA/RNA helicase [Dinoroseobacter phage vB_DshS-R5C]